MRVLIDCDLLLDVGLQREPHFQSSATLLDWAESHPGFFGVAWHGIANVSYLLGGNGKAYIEDFSRFLEVAPVDSPALDFALRLPMKDFEDALQVAAADAFGAQIIATRNLKHYRDSPIRAMSPSGLLPVLRS